MIFLLLTTTLLHNYPNETMPAHENFLLDYSNEYYVETGASGGGSVIRALDVRYLLPGKFKSIASIDIDPHSIEICKMNLRVPNVHFLLGDSSIKLWDMIKDIPKPITFWLDAHRFPPVDDGKKNCPLLEELEQIRKHPLNTHTILIDDVPCCGTPAFDYITVEQLIEKLLEINPNYQIKFIYGQVLAATPKRSP